jgi:hypothetical protein
MDKIQFIKPNTSNVQVDLSDNDNSLFLPDLETPTEITNTVEVENENKDTKKVTIKDSSDKGILSTEKINEVDPDFLDDFNDTFNNIGVTDSELDKNNTITDDSDYTDKVTEWIQNGYIIDIPDELDPSEDEPVTLDTFNKIIEHNLPLLKEKAVVDALSQLSPELQQAVIFEQDGGNVTEYLNILNTVATIKNLDPTKAKDQSTIVSEFYLDAGLSIEDVEEKIEDLRKANLLEKEATKLKPRLDEKATAISEAKAKEQEDVSHMKDKANQYAANRVTEKLVKGFDSLTFTKNNAIDLFNKIMVEQDFNYGNKIQKKSGIEYLIDFHKFSETGSPERLIKALMILDPSGAYDDVLTKNFKNKVAEEFVSAHIKDSNKKYNTSTQNRNNNKSTKKFELKG